MRSFTARYLGKIKESEGEWRPRESFGRNKLIIASTCNQRRPRFWRLTLNHPECFVVQVKGYGAAYGKDKIKNSMNIELTSICKG